MLSSPPSSANGSRRGVSGRLRRPVTTYRKCRGSECSCDGVGEFGGSYCELGLVLRTRARRRAGNKRQRIGAEPTLTSPFFNLLHSDPPTPEMSDSVQGSADRKRKRPPTFVHLPRDRGMSHSYTAQCRCLSLTRSVLVRATRMISQKAQERLGRDEKGQSSMEGREETHGTASGFSNAC